MVGNLNMGYYFSPYRIAEMAMQVEEAGVEFYKNLASRNKDETTKKVFLFLADQELSHYKGFSVVASEMKQNNSEYEYSIDVARLLQQSIDDLKDSAFNTNSPKTDSIDIKKCLDIAIHIEEESARIYQEIYKSFIEKFHKVILKIINEEEKHLKTLLNVKEKLRV